LTRIDRAVVGALSLVLLALTVAIGATSPAVSTPPLTAGTSPSVSATPSGPRPYREGVIGRATSISPLTARTRADRDLVGLVFSGLVALGPDGSLVPDLASRWSSDKTGKTWTFHLADRQWQDGVAVTAADVVFTVHTMQDPDYTGPAVGSWTDVTAVAVDERTVRFKLATPLAGFLQAAMLPIVPAHLLEDVPIDQLADDPFGQAPVGTGPYRLVSLDDLEAILAPADQPANAQPAATSDANGTIPLPGIEIHFFDDPVTLARAYETGEIDAVAGLAASEATRLASMPDTRVMKYPTTTLTAAFFNLRISHATFRDVRVRKALLTAIDRTKIVASAYGDAATRADSLVPPTSWAFDQKSSPEVTFSRAAARRVLRKVGWRYVNGAWRNATGNKPITFELLGPDANTNPATYAAVSSIVDDWRTLGLRVKQVGLSPSELVGERIQTGNFEAVVVDINVGLDPDLYPILASTQTRSGGLNIAGIQDQNLDKLLAAARKPGSKTARVAAYRALEKALGTANYVLPICFRDEIVVVRNTVSGPTIRPISDGSERFWDVLTWRLAIGR
jgi:peptide/nickel transport system substrate-binding protein